MKRVFNRVYVLGGDSLIHSLLSEDKRLEVYDPRVRPLIPAPATTSASAGDTSCCGP